MVMYMDPVGKLISRWKGKLTTPLQASGFGLHPGHLKPQTLNPTPYLTGGERQLVHATCNGHCGWAHEARRKGSTKLMLEIGCMLKIACIVILHIDTHTYTYIHIYIYIYLFIYLWICRCVYIYIYAHNN